MDNQQSIIDTKEYFCEEHNSQKIFITLENNSHLLICEKCLSENKTIQDVRHKLVSNLSKDRFFYSLILFSMVTTVISSIFELINSFISRPVDYFTILKLVIAILAVIVIDFNVKKKHHKD